MARINLLPWREELRQQKKQEFFSAIGTGAILTLLVFGIVYWHIEQIKEYQQMRNTMIENEILVVNRKIKEIRDIDKKKDKLLTKIEVIQKLQESRPQIVHLFDELPKTTPDGIFLTKFTQAGKDLSFSGKAQSNARVSAYMRNIESSPWLKTPVLEVIKGGGKAADGSLNNFSMRAMQGENKPKNSEDQE